MKSPDPATGPIVLALPRLAILDLDGTLADTVPDLAACADRMLEGLGLPARGERAARRVVGNRVQRFVERSLTGDMDARPDPALLASALPRFLDLYATHGRERSRVYPGVIEGLDWLQAAGVRLGCVTNKPGRYTEPLLVALGLRARFEVLLGGDALPVKKPDPAPLLHAARETGVEPERCLMIGDSVNDVRAARGAGMPVVCVTYGYNHGADIRDAGADAVIGSLADLPGLLRPGPRPAD